MWQPANGQNVDSAHDVPKRSVSTQLRRTRHTCNREYDAAAALSSALAFVFDVGMEHDHPTVWTQSNLTVARM